ncbi:MAG: CBS domain-containing protein [Pseudomonadales bacterium]|nr:CBS domain-containing protein [Pseudomonadales bacterium]
MPTKVSEYMSPKVITANEDLGIREAYFLMREEGIRHLPVVGDDGTLLGIVSDRELRRPNWVDEAPDLQHQYQLDDDMQVKDIMIRHVYLVHTYDTLSKAVKLVLEHKIGALPVMDKNEALVGMLSAVDLLQALNDIFDANKAKRKMQAVG